MKINETPVLLLTGYLGSGKTTLLNRILSNKNNIKFAVIVNDIGEVNVDAELIQKGGIVGEQDDSLVALQNGCICCTLKMDLIQQLNDLVSSKSFDYIVIEASGICEPSPIAETISTYPRLLSPEMMKNGIARLDAIVTVVDSLRMRDEFRLGDRLQEHIKEEEDLASLVIQQLEFCNIIILNKASEISTQELDHLKAVVHELQPHAKIITCNYGDFSLDEILNTHLFDLEKVATSSKWFEALDNEDNEHEDCHSHHHEEHHHHHGEHHHHHHGEGEALEYGIETFVYYRRQPLNLLEFDQFVAKNWPKSVIRAKGMCYFADEPDTCYLFEQAGRQMNIKHAGQWYASLPEQELKELLQKNPDIIKYWEDGYGDRMQKIVFIGQHMDKEAIIKALDSCLEQK